MYMYLANIQLSSSHYVYLDIGTHVTNKSITG